jgi:predicted nucleic acid-binding protein
MLVIADTTPLRYLVVLGQVDLLPTLFGQVIIPLAVVGELQHSKAPAAVRAWIASPPPWLDIRPSSLLPDAVLLRLDPGEREAILLAQELQADLVLVDDQDARAEATRRALTAMGTLRVANREHRRAKPQTSTLACPHSLRISRVACPHYLQMCPHYLSTAREHRFVLTLSENGVLV